MPVLLLLFFSHREKGNERVKNFKPQVFVGHVCNVCERKQGMKEDMMPEMMMIMIAMREKRLPQLTFRLQT